jgi:hypothetical protein
MASSIDLHPPVLFASLLERYILENLVFIRFIGDKHRIMYHYALDLRMSKYVHDAVEFINVGTKS